MVTPVDTMSGIVRDRVTEWGDLSGSGGSVDFPEETVGETNNW
jgi:hypothetical protein